MAYARGSRGESRHEKTTQQPAHCEAHRLTSYQTSAANTALPNATAMLHRHRHPADPSPAPALPTHVHTLPRVFYLVPLTQGHILFSSAGAGPPELRGGRAWPQSSSRPAGGASSSARLAASRSFSAWSASAEQAAGVASWAWYSQRLGSSTWVRSSAGPQCRDTCGGGGGWGGRGVLCWGWGCGCAVRARCAVWWHMRVDGVLAAWCKLLVHRNPGGGNGAVGRAEQQAFATIPTTHASSPLASQVQSKRAACPLFHQTLTRPPTPTHPPVTTYLDAPRRALPAVGATRELHRRVALPKPAPAAQVGAGVALLLGGLLEGADLVGVLVHLWVEERVGCVIGVSKVSKGGEWGVGDRRRRVGGADLVGVLVHLRGEGVGGWGGGVVCWCG